MHATTSRYSTSFYIRFAYGTFIWCEYQSFFASVSVSHSFFFMSHWMYHLSIMQSIFYVCTCTKGKRQPSSSLTHALVLQLNHLNIHLDVSCPLSHIYNRNWAHLVLPHSTSQKNRNINLRLLQNDTFAFIWLCHSWYT